MPEDMKNKIRPMYSELQGYLAQAPPQRERDTGVKIETMRALLAAVISELNEVSGKDYNRFQITSDDCYGSPDNPLDFMLINKYRAKLGGLIARLHGEYFADEQAPFSGMPSTVIQQTQQQHQTVDIALLLDIRGTIEQKIPTFGEGTKEKKFLQKVKDLLGSVSSAKQLFSLILSTAKEFGLSPEDIQNLIGY